MRVSNAPNHFPVFSAITSMFRGRTLLLLIFIVLLFWTGTTQIRNDLSQATFKEYAAQNLDLIAASPTYIFVLVSGIASALLLLVLLGGLGYLDAPRWLRGDRGYERDHPIPGVHPVVVSRLWNGCALVDDLVVALLELANKKAISLKIVDFSKDLPKKRSSKKVDYEITVFPYKSESLSDAIDQCLYDFLFEESRAGVDGLLLSKLLDEKNLVGPRHRQRDFLVDFFRTSYIAALKSGLLSRGRTRSEKSAADLKSGPFSSESARVFMMRFAFVGVMLVPFLLGMIIFYNEDINQEIFSMPILRWVFILPWITYFIAGVIFDKKRSAEGRRALSRCHNLKRWLKDFTLLDERDAQGVLVWGKYAVYAYALDVSEKSIKELSVLGSAVDSVVINSVTRKDGLFSTADEYDLDNYHRLIQGDKVYFHDDK